MQYRYLGNSGLKVSALSFGAWVTFGDQIGEDVATDLMKTAYDHGVNFFDNAEGYSGGKAETMMGNVIKKQGWKRSDIVVSTKIFWGGERPQRPRTFAQAHHRGHQSGDRTLSDGLRGPRILPPARPAHTHRRDRPGDELSVGPRVGLLLGHERMVRRADSPSL